ncbi:hypothetical protein [Butyrivibrio sp. LC3010]|uniref:hypothetical protein n=1 Tax=Butyrivibrio sp. LC3010 TaxID=1280680 RepID=UPI00040DAB76|nr:hypothetical protein [Butyrivibrio sp. LC3010]
MKLKKTWIGVCVGVIYLLGMIFAIGVTGFVSGLFPAYDRFLVAGGTVAAAAVLAFIVSFILGQIGDRVNDIESVNSFSKPIWLEILVVISLILIGIFAYSHTAALIAEYTGNITLYDSALLSVSDTTVELNGIADVIYVGLLRIVISFLGNTLSAVFALNMILRIMMVVFAYIAIRISLGMVAGIAAGTAFFAIPAFGYSLRVVDSKQLLFTAVWFELMLVVMYVVGFEKSAGNRWFYKIFSIVLGAIIGTMIYLEAGSAAIIVFLIAAWMLADMECETINVCINEILLLLSGVAAFIGMLVFEGGMDSVPNTYYLWTWRFYGYNENSWLKMIDDSTPNTYFALGLLAAALIPAALTILRDRCEKIVPWLAFSVLGIVMSVFLGDTLTNSEVFIISSIVVLISCGVSCAAYNDIVEDIKEEPEIEEDDEEDEEDEESEEGAPEAELNNSKRNASEENKIIEIETEQTEAFNAEANKSESERAEDRNIEANKSESERTEVDNTEVNKFESDRPEADNVVVNLPESEHTKVHKIQDLGSSSEVEKEARTPRYVPEGMVLPTGDEDEENLVPHFNLNRPQMEDVGILSVGTAKNNDETKDEAKIEPKVEGEDESKAAERAELRERAYQSTLNDKVIADVINDVIAEINEGVRHNNSSDKDDFDVVIRPGDDFDI